MEQKILWLLSNFLSFSEKYQTHLRRIFLLEVFQGFSGFNSALNSSKAFFDRPYGDPTKYKLGIIGVWLKSNIVGDS